MPEIFDCVLYKNGERLWGVYLCPPCRDRFVKQYESRYEVRVTTAETGLGCNSGQELAYGPDCQDPPHRAFVESLTEC